jgi:hypothetical protein
MCSYNAVSGVPTCASDMLTSVLRGACNFTGYITSAGGGPPGGGGAAGGLQCDCAGDRKTMAGARLRWEDRRTASVGQMGQQRFLRRARLSHRAKSRDGNRMASSGTGTARTAASSAAPLTASFLAEFERTLAAAGSATNPPIPMRPALRAPTPAPALPAVPAPTPTLPAVPAPTPALPAGPAPTPALPAGPAPTPALPAGPAPLPTVPARTPAAAVPARLMPPPLPPVPAPMPAGPAPLPTVPARTPAAAVPARLMPPPLPPVPAPMPAGPAPLPTVPARTPAAAVPARLMPPPLPTEPARTPAPMYAAATVQARLTHTTTAASVLSPRPPGHPGPTVSTHRPDSGRPDDVTAVSAARTRAREMDGCVTFAGLIMHLRDLSPAQAEMLQVHHYRNGVVQLVYEMDRAVTTCVRAVLSVDPLCPLSSLEEASFHAIMNNLRHAAGGGGGGRGGGAAGGGGGDEASAPGLPPWMSWDDCGMGQLHAHPVLQGFYENAPAPTAPRSEFTSRQVTFHDLITSLAAVRHRVKECTWEDVLLHVAASRGGDIRDLVYPRILVETKRLSLPYCITLTGQADRMRVQGMEAAKARGGPGVVAESIRAWSVRVATSKGALTESAAIVLQQVLGGDSRTAALQAVVRDHGQLLMQAVSGLVGAVPRRGQPLIAADHQAAVGAAVAAATADPAVPQAAFWLLVRLYASLFDAVRAVTAETDVLPAASDASPPAAGGGAGELPSPPPTAASPSRTVLQALLDTALLTGDAVSASAVHAREEDARREAEIAAANQVRAAEARLAAEAEAKRAAAFTTASCEVVMPHAVHSVLNAPLRSVLDWALERRVEVELTTSKDLPRPLREDELRACAAESEQLRHQALAVQEAFGPALEMESLEVARCMESASRGWLEQGAEGGGGLRGDSLATLSRFVEALGLPDGAALGDSAPRSATAALAAVRSAVRLHWRAADAAEVDSRLGPADDDLSARRAMSAILRRSHSATDSASTTHLPALAAVLAEWDSRLDNAEAPPSSPEPDVMPRLRAVPLMGNIADALNWQDRFAPALGSLSSWLRARVAELEAQAVPVHIMEESHGTFVRIAAPGDGTITAIIGALSSGSAALAAARVASWLLQPGAHLPGLTNRLMAWARTSMTASDFEAAAKVRTLLDALSCMTPSMQRIVGALAVIPALLHCDGFNFSAGEVRELCTRTDTRHAIPALRNAAVCAARCPTLLDLRSSIVPLTDLDTAPAAAAVVPRVAPGPELSAVVGQPATGLLTGGEAPAVDAAGPVVTPSALDGSADGTLADDLLERGLHLLSSVPLRDTVPGNPRDAQAVVEHIRALWQRERFGEAGAAAAGASEFTRIAGRAAEAVTRHVAGALYASAEHFLYELLQNAEDNQYPADVTPEVKVEVNAQRTMLRVLSNETGFRVRDIWSICNLADSTKRIGEAVGNKGIGWKSVFGVSQTPTVRSRYASFRFDARPPEHGGMGRLGRLAPQWIAATDEYTNGTAIELQLEAHGRTVDGDTLMPASKVDDAVARLARQPSVLLFLRRVNALVFGTGGTGLRMVRHVEPIAVDASASTARVAMTARATRVDSMDAATGAAVATTRFVCFSAELPLPADMADISHRRVTTLSIAVEVPTATSPGPDPAPAAGAGGSSVFVHLPVRDYGLPFHLQADFLLASSREALQDDHPFNAYLALEVLPLVVREAWPMWRDWRRSTFGAGSAGDDVATYLPICDAWLALLPLESATRKHAANAQAPDGGLFTRAAAATMRAMATCPCIATWNGNLVAPAAAVRIPPAIAKNLDTALLHAAGITPTAMAAALGKQLVHPDLANGRPLELWKALGIKELTLADVSVLMHGGGGHGAGAVSSTVLARLQVLDAFAREASATSRPLSGLMELLADCPLLLLDDGTTTAPKAGVAFLPESDSKDNGPLSAALAALRQGGVSVPCLHADVVAAASTRPWLHPLLRRLGVSTLGLASLIDHVCLPLMEGATPATPTRAVVACTSALFYWVRQVAPMATRVARSASATAAVDPEVTLVETRMASDTNWTRLLDRVRTSWRVVGVDGRHAPIASATFAMPPRALPDPIMSRVLALHDAARALPAGGPTMLTPMADEHALLAAPAPGTPYSAELWRLLRLLRIPEAFAHLPVQPSAQELSAAEAGSPGDASGDELEGAPLLEWIDGCVRVHTHAASAGDVAAAEAACAALHATMEYVDARARTASLHSSSPMLVALRARCWLPRLSDAPSAALTLHTPAELTNLELQSTVGNFAVYTRAPVRGHLASLLGVVTHWSSARSLAVLRAIAEQASAAAADGQVACLHADPGHPRVAPCPSDVPRDTAAVCSVTLLQALYAGLDSHVSVESVPLWIPPTGAACKQALDGAMARGQFTSLADARLWPIDPFNGELRCVGVWGIDVLTSSARSLMSYGPIYPHKCALADLLRQHWDAVDDPTLATWETAIARLVDGKFAPLSNAPTPESAVQSLLLQLAAARSNPAVEYIRDALLDVRRDVPLPAVLRALVSVDSAEAPPSRVVALRASQRRDGLGGDAGWRTLVLSDDEERLRRMEEYWQNAPRGKDQFAVLSFPLRKRDAPDVDAAMREFLKCCPASRASPLTGALKVLDPMGAKRFLTGDEFTAWHRWHWTIVCATLQHAVESTVLSADEVATLRDHAVAPFLRSVAAPSFPVATPATGTLFVPHAATDVLTGELFVVYREPCPARLVAQQASVTVGNMTMIPALSQGTLFLDASVLESRDPTTWCQCLIPFLCDLLSQVMPHGFDVGRIQQTTRTLAHTIGTLNLEGVRDRRADAIALARRVRSSAVWSLPSDLQWFSGPLLEPPAEPDVHLAALAPPASLSSAEPLAAGAAEDAGGTRVADAEFEALALSLASRPRPRAVVGGGAVGDDEFQLVADQHAAAVRAARAAAAEQRAATDAVVAPPADVVSASLGLAAPAPIGGYAHSPGTTPAPTLAAEVTGPRQRRHSHDGGEMLRRALEEDDDAAAGTRRHAQHDDAADDVGVGHGARHDRSHRLAEGDGEEGSMAPPVHAQWAPSSTAVDPESRGDPFGLHGLLRRHLSGDRDDDGASSEAGSSLASPSRRDSWVPAAPVHPRERPALSVTCIPAAATAPLAAQLHASLPPISLGAPSERSTSVGRAGEVLAYALLQMQLRSTALLDAALRGAATWVNQSSESGLPYDLTVVPAAAAGDPRPLRYVEVKSTSTVPSGMEAASFFVSPEEVAFATRCRARNRSYQLWLLQGVPPLESLLGPDADESSEVTPSPELMEQALRRITLTIVNDPASAINATPQAGDDAPTLQLRLLLSPAAAAHTPLAGGGGGGALGPPAPVVAGELHADTTGGAQGGPVAGAGAGGR